MEEKNEKDDVEKYSSDDIIKKLELMNRELDDIRNEKIDDSNSTSINSQMKNPSLDFWVLNYNLLKYKWLYLYYLL